MCTAAKNSVKLQPELSNSQNDLLAPRKHLHVSQYITQKTFVEKSQHELKDRSKLKFFSDSAQKFFPILLLFILNNFPFSLKCCRRIRKCSSLYVYCTVLQNIHVQQKVYICDQCGFKVNKYNVVQVPCTVNILL